MSDLFNNLGKMRNLGGLMKGIANLMPQDNPNTQKMRLQGEISELQGKADKLYLEIGRMALEEYGPDGFGEAGAEIAGILNDLSAKEAEMAEIQRAEEEARAEAEAREGKVCPECGYNNPEDVRFCQDCGAKLETPILCPECGAENAPGIKFCGECGTRLAVPAQAPVCPECGAENAPGTKFCGECGAKLVP